MNKRILQAEMRLNGDTGKTLSDYLGVAQSTLSAKINETKGAEFTQGEISKIKARYALSADRVDEIFFADMVSK